MRGLRAYIEIVRRRNSMALLMSAMRRPEAIHSIAFKDNTQIHPLEYRMNDYRAIEKQIHSARLEKSRDLGESIANTIFALWITGNKLLSRAAANLDAFVRAPDSYSTAMPRHFS